MNLEGPSSTSIFLACRALGTLCRRHLYSIFAGVLIVAASFAVAAPVAYGDSASLDGTWRGSGWVKFDNGKRERARCRAFYSRVSPNEFQLRANCATKSAKATQTARVFRSGKSRYSGTFFNKEYGVSGNIYISVRGRSQNVRLTGAGGSANFNLRK